jgi:hypothetical protein
MYCTQKQENRVSKADDEQEPERSRDENDNSATELAIENDLFCEMPSSYPARFPRLGYGLSYVFDCDHTTIHIHRFAGCSLPKAGLENVEFDALHLLLRIRVSTDQCADIEDDNYPLKGTLLTYYFEVVSEALEKILVLAGADKDTCTDALAQLRICNNNYSITLN